MRGEVGDQLQPGGQQLPADVGEVAVPDVEGLHRLAARQPGGLQQGVALLEHPVVVAADAGQPRGAGDQQLVEEAATLGGVAPDEREVLRREEHRPDQTQQLPRPREGRAVDPDPVGPPGVDLDLDQQLPVAAAQGRPHHRLRVAVPDQGGSVDTR